MTALFKKLLTFFVFSDAVLLNWHASEIPKRDLIACLACTVCIQMAYKMKREKQPKIKDRRFQLQANILESLEIIFTVFAPWAILVCERFGVRNFTKKGEAAHYLAPHLFIFQAQIIFECFLFVMGESHKWMIFPYTCIANTYRFVPLSTGVFRHFQSYDHASRNQIDMAVLFAVQTSTVALWIASSFYFIPFVWYPAIQKSLKEIKSQ